MLAYSARAFLSAKYCLIHAVAWAICSCGAGGAYSGRTGCSNKIGFVGFADAVHSIVDGYVRPARLRDAASGDVLSARIAFRATVLRDDAVKRGRGRKRNGGRRTRAPGPPHNRHCADRVTDSL